jgi:hypothetical protein
MAIHGGGLMTIELLNERKIILEQQLQNAQIRLEQAMADINAIHGAIKEVEFWTNKTSELSEKI